MSTRTSAELVLYQDGTVMIKGDTNASAGYLYVRLPPHRGGQRMSVLHEHRTGCQVFQFAIYRWCINHAEELIEADPDAARLVEGVPVEQFRQFLSLESPRPGYMKLIEVHVNPEHAATVDLSKPIMLAPIVTHSNENLGGMAIDGWHRIYRALTEGIAELPAHILTEATSVAAQIPWR